MIPFLVTTVLIIVIAFHQQPAAEGLDDLLHSLRRVPITDEASLSELAKRTEELLKQFPDPESHAAILYTTALVHTRHGHRFPESSHAAIAAALNVAQPPGASTASNNVLWRFGDAIA